MDEYSMRVSRAVRNFKEINRLSSVEIADKLHMAISTFNSKMSGARRWNLDDLKALSKLGVRLPKIEGRK